MNPKSCLRCGSIDLQAGVIYDSEKFSKSPLMFRWKLESSFGTDMVLLDAILCKSCGHTELVVDIEVFLRPKKCPSCGASYRYSKEKIKEGTVACQNCGNLFLIQGSDES